MSAISPVPLHDAVSQIDEIQRRLAHAETFRGYRAATIAGTAVFALIGAALQTRIAPRPQEQPITYVTIWGSIAAACLLFSVGQVIWRAWSSGSRLTTRQTWLALQQFLPCPFAGAVVTAVISESVPDALWLLPGLWSLFFGLGVWASRRLLPGPVAAVGIYYLLAGSACFFTGRGEWACSPWLMLLTFGIGQTALAVIMYSYLEQSDAAA
ncbi:MAG: hypothetical protein U0872_09615 [Planctomycetaceae bacterium]